jgi:putative transposase
MAGEIGNLRQAAKVLENIVRMRIDMEKDLRCKYCNSRNVVRNGHSRNKQQRYLCKKCGSVFIDNDALPRMQISIRQLGEVIGQYYGGMSLKELRRQFEQQHNKTLSRSSFDRWLAKFSKIAVSEASKYHPKVGDTWIADETVLKIGGKNIWCWDVIDSDSRFLLATHLSLTRTTKDAQALMEKAGSIAGKAPKVVLTDSLRAYIDGIELTWGGETKHIQSKPFAEADISTNKIERFHSTLKTRTEIMRGLKSLKTAQALLDGWLVHYNFFRSHESLDDKTPAEEAEVKFPYKDWLDVIEAQSPKHKSETIKSLPKSLHITYKAKHRDKIRKKRTAYSSSVVRIMKE